MALAQFEPVTPIGPKFRGCVADQVGPARDGFDHRNVVGLGKAGEFVGRARILDAAARDDDGPFGRSQQGGGIGDLASIGRLAADAVHALGEEFDRIVIGPALHVLRQAEEGRAAIGGIEHRGKGGGQRLQDLRGMGDAVPVADDGA